MGRTTVESQFSVLHNVRTDWLWGPLQSPVQRGLGALFLGVKQLRHWSNHSCTLDVEVKNAWSYSAMCVHSMELN
jgi:hypothetical protein